MYSRAGRHSLINDQALFIRLVAFIDILSAEGRVEALVKSRHPGESRGPVLYWFPAFAGMTLVLDF